MISFILHPFGLVLLYVVILCGCYYSFVSKYYFVLAAFIFSLTGATCNILVVSINGKKMPSRLSREESMDTKNHYTVDEKTHLVFLADVIPTRNGYMSIGDVFLRVSGVLCSFEIIYRMMIH